jgi:hypothetical protein
MKKAFNATDNNIPAAPSAAGAKPPASRGGERNENTVTMPQIHNNIAAALDPASRNFKSEWRVSNSLGLVGLTHTNGYP